MTTSRTLLAVLVTALLVVGTAAPAAAGALSGSPAAEGAQSASQVSYSTAAENNSSVNVSVGQQLSTVVSVTSDDVETEIENTAFEMSFERAGEDAKAEAIADRAEELRERAAAIREDYREATNAYENGELTKSEYAQRLATLNARAKNVLNGLEQLRDRAQNVSSLDLRAAGVTATELENVSENLSSVTGAGPTALLQRFVGSEQGEVEISTTNGLSIEAESEGGERSRELRRPSDDDTNITVNQTAALGTARNALASPSEGTWTLVTASVHEEEGYYKFEFRLNASNATGEAEVRVDGSSGEVFRLEEEIEAGGTDDEREEARDDEEREGDELALVVASGTPSPNATVTVKALANGSALEGATVTLNGEQVGTTDANGTVTVTLPASGEAKLVATAGDREGELEFEFEEREDVYRALQTDVSVAENQTTVSVTYEGSAVKNAAVYANGEQVGTTDADGTVTFATPDVEELEIEIVKGEFEAELKFQRQNGQFVQTEAAHEGDGDKAEDEEDETDDESDDETDDESDDETDDESDDEQETTTEDDSDDDEYDEEETTTTDDDSDDDDDEEETTTTEDDSDE